MADATDRPKIIKRGTWGTVQQIAQAVLHPSVDAWKAVIYGYDGANYQAAKVDSSGRLNVIVGAGGSSGGQVDAHPVTSAGVTLVDTQGGQTYEKVGIVADGDKYVRGVVAHDAVDTGIEPVVIGSQASTNAPTAVAVGDIVRPWVDTAGRIHITGDASATALPVTTTSGLTTINTGRTTVTTAGTRVVLAASTACKRIVIQALYANTGRIAVGGTGVVAASGTEQGQILFAGDSFELEIDNLNDVNIDSSVNGEGVSYTAFN